MYQIREGDLYLKKVDHSQWNGKASNTPNTNVHIRDIEDITWPLGDTKFLFEC